MPEDPRSTKSRRRLFWFSVMAVFFLVVVGLLVGMIAVPWLQYRNQQQIITRIEALGGWAETEQRGPRWLCQILGDWYCMEILAVGFDTTEITDEDLAILQEVPFVVHVYLGGTAVSDRGLARIGDLRKLRELDLGGTRVTDEGLRHLRGLPDLEWVNLGHTQITDAGLAQLATMPKITAVYADGTFVTEQGVRAFRTQNPTAEIVSSTAPGEEQRRIAAKLLQCGASVVHGRHPLFGLDLADTGDTAVSWTYYVRLWSTAGTDTEIQELLRRLSELEPISLSLFQVRKGRLAFLSQLDNVTTLELCGPFRDLPPQELSHIESLDKLQILHLTRWSISEIEAEQMSAISQVGRLWMTAVSVVGADVSCLAKLENLERLGLTQCDDTDVAHLALLPRLESLSLEGSGVTDAALVHLGSLPSLQELMLESTAITDDGLSHLAKLTSLRSLSVEYTQVTDAGLAHLQTLDNLKELSLTGTDVSQAAVAKLQQALPHVKITQE
ncbi:MAG: hypothetical protein HQ567_10690 [Candidatus Nealsonbacteria bacterium]|nr:hypothetical protein [Candidatus Nealsonbacteria bacterium]